MATGDDLELGATNNSADHQTFLAVQASHAPGLHITNSGNGSVSDPLTALRGEAGGVNSVAVFGVSDKGIGVQGEATGGTGVRGEARSGTGVRGEVRSGTGVRGDSSTGIGVIGDSDGDVGVHGESNRWWGVEGTGLGGVQGQGQLVGVLGVASRREQGLGVWGISGGGVGVFGSSSGGLAGRFDGDVFINGSLTKTGAGGCVAVPFPDGSLHRLYSIESPESWFEDFGEARLVGGKAKVKIDRGFAAVVRGRYHVFLTAYGDSNGLYVSRRKRKGFVVREQNGGKSDLRFSYRIVARRKDIEGPRLEKVERPAGPKSAVRTLRKRKAS